jgi:hypothetical protein
VAKRQLLAAGIGFSVLGNGLREVDDPAAAERTCERLGAGHLHVFLQRWLARLPSPLTAADQAAGFSYQFSVRQLEVADTAVFDQPQAGRAWFQAAIGEHLDLGRPEQVRLLVDRRITRQPPGRFQTRLITRDIDPTCGSTTAAPRSRPPSRSSAPAGGDHHQRPRDFGVGRRLTSQNWQALRQIGVATNARFLAALGEGRRPRPTRPPLRRWSCRPSVTASEHQDCASEIRG